MAYTYRNARTGQIVSYPARDPLLDTMPSLWLLLEQTPIQDTPPTPDPDAGEQILDEAVPEAVVQRGEHPAAPPSADAGKASWVAYAIERGIDAAQAQRATKSTLMRRFGPERG